LLEWEKGKQQEGEENTTNKPETPAHQMMLQRLARSFENISAVTTVFVEANPNMDRRFLAAQEMMKCVSAYRKAMRKER
jgi:hypothetical protein